MLLRVRVTLPDRPGALGQVARTLGVAGADIVQVVVLERLGGRAVDDFTVVWPGAARVERLLAGLAAIPGVQVDGVWKAIGAPVSGGHDAELLAQVAANPQDGLATLVDAVPGLLAADWAAAAVVPADWAARSAGFSAGLSTGSEPSVAYASWRAPDPLRLPEVTPLRERPMTGPDGTKYAVAPFGRAGLVLVVARPEDEELPGAAFHITEVDRIAQLVRAAAVILGDRLDRAGVPPVATAVTDPS
ncbi:amino acid-binding ACT domain-containing protein [Actinoplanes sp. N902-109]|uniref:amino acid-binding ACT domain-containing protein n=1 Tax=Actinoplanes sp. (strain N902-109) TaxID=649831 RepID=UPI0003294591|nr:amino acid-binding ACT domain-containing protein [Actinoplanes sp. N902-109]AGL20139.1 amino acid-binding ACT domain-containing protein [Actinoplanes sp. N902-109]